MTSETLRLPRTATLKSGVNRALRAVPPWVLYLAGGAYAAWAFYLALTGGLGVEPITALEHLYGEVALQLLIAGLAVTPIRQWAGVNLLPFRRALGVLTFFFVLAHFLVWAVLDVQTVSAIWADILERPYVTIGMAGFALLIPLGLTSNTLSIRRMGAAAWRKLHKLVYPAAILGALHYVWLAKGFQIEPLVYMTLVLGLLALRLVPPKRRTA